MDFEQTIIESMHIDTQSKILLPDRKKLLMFLNNLSLFTGRLDIIYCNTFLDEAARLLINSIFLYEDGYFDCAFYSIRQSSELINNMLYLSNNERSTLTDWSTKEWFPMDNRIRSHLEKLSESYKEIKTLIPEYFDKHDDLIKKSNKVIHKQGFDTFYRLRTTFPDEYNFSQEEEIKQFEETLKYTIGVLLIVFIILEPISLALADEEVSPKLNYNLLTEPIDTDYFEEFLGLNDIIPKIKGSKFYQNYIAAFADKEPMLPSVFSVVREEAWDVDALDEIEKQLNLLTPYERFMFHILKCGIRISNFYYCHGWNWYFTTIRCNYNRKSFGGEEFENYLKASNLFNQPCANVYMSVLMMYEEPLYLEHNDPLSEEEIQKLKDLEAEGIQEVQKLNADLAEIMKEDN
ncbi:MAG TPA: hypothetical protein PLU75_06105 [Oscillospiraceae bacterium]|nr:hypothetical protein [Oscillospiraceae bacterium]